MYQTEAATASAAICGLDNCRYNDSYRLRMGHLQREIKQDRPFANLEEEVFLNLQRTADLLMCDIEELLRPHQLSPTQYNVLRILRGSRDTGLACHEITERMVTHDPDMTRLLDRLEERGLLARSREKDDRRVIRVRIAAQGLSLLRTLDEPVKTAHKKQLGHLGERRLRLLSGLLEAARNHNGQQN